MENSSNQTRQQTHRSLPANSMAIREIKWRHARPLSPVARRDAHRPTPKRRRAMRQASYTKEQVEKCRRNPSADLEWIQTPYQLSRPTLVDSPLVVVIR